MNNQITQEIQETVVSGLNLTQSAMGYVTKIAVEKPYLLAGVVGLVLLKGKKLKMGKGFNVSL